VAADLSHVRVGCRDRRLLQSPFERMLTAVRNCDLIANHEICDAQKRKGRAFDLP